MAKFRGRFLKNKGIAISKSDRVNGDDAKNTSEFAKSAAPLRHALIEELKKINSDS